MGAWELPIAILYYAAGLLFWPVFQLFHRRRSPLSRRLLNVFFTTLGVLVAYGVLLISTWRGHEWFPLLLLFPVLNLISLTISILVCALSSESSDHIAAQAANHHPGTSVSR